VKKGGGFMSIGLYIITNEKFQEIRVENDFQSLNELLASGYTKQEIMIVLKNLGIDYKDVDPLEKVFCIYQPEDALSFQIVKEAGETIRKYTGRKSKYCYEIFINDSKRFCLEFTAYLKEYNFSFEIWKIWEDFYAPDNIRTLDFTNISEEHIQMILEDYSYSDPIVGRFWL
jgi:hypothetical protein